MAVQCLLPIRQDGGRSALTKFICSHIKWEKWTKIVQRTWYDIHFGEQIPDIK